MKRGPRWPQFVRLDLRAVSAVSCRIIAAIDGDILYGLNIDAHADVRFLTTTTGLSWHLITSQYYDPGGRIAGGCVTGAAHVVGSVWHTGCRWERRALESRGWNGRRYTERRGASVPGLHKNMRRNFFGLSSVRSSLSVLCRPCSAHVASRASLGRCLRRLCLMSAFGSANMRWT